MNIKYFLQILFLTFFTFSSQGQQKQYIVEYMCYNDTDSPNMYKVVLATKGNAAIYQEKLNTKKGWKQEKIDTTGVRIYHKPASYDPSLKIDLTKKEMFFYDKIGDNMMLVKDVFHDFKWDITSETKKISGYTCTKATTFYRGRKWIAWFTPDIPLSFGPWKLHGLPGLILKANDADNIYTFVAEKIEQKNSPLFEKDFTEIYQHSNSVTYQQFMVDTDEYRNNIRKEYAVDGVTVQVNKNIPRTGMELKYEWEE